jgi:hypothetical protein
MRTFEITIVCRSSEALPQDTVRQIAAYCGLRFLTCLTETTNRLTFVGKAEASAVRTFAEIMRMRSTNDAPRSKVESA